MKRIDSQISVPDCLGRPTIRRIQRAAMASGEIVGRPALFGRLAPQASIATVSNPPARSAPARYASASGGTGTDFDTTSRRVHPSRQHSGFAD